MHTAQTTLNSLLTPHLTNSSRRQQQADMRTHLFLFLPYSVILAPANTPVHGPAPTHSTYNVCTTNSISHISHFALLRLLTSPVSRSHAYSPCSLQTYTLSVTIAAKPVCSPPLKYGARVVDIRMGSNPTSHEARVSHFARFHPKPHIGRLTTHTSHKLRLRYPDFYGMFFKIVR